MKISYDGRERDFDVTEMDVAQCEVVEKYVGKGLGEWSNQLAAGSIKSLVALWWAMRSQAGEDPGPIGQPGPGFKPVKLLVAFNEAQAAEAAADAEEEAQADPDPTSAPGSPAPGDTTTTPAGPPPDSPSRPG